MMLFTTGGQQQRGLQGDRQKCMRLNVTPQAAHAPVSQALKNAELPACLVERVVRKVGEESMHIHKERCAANVLTRCPLPTCMFVSFAVLSDLPSLKPRKNS